jgi:hypothetical protein
MNQSKSPPIPTSSYSSFGGSGCLGGASFLAAGLVSSLAGFAAYLAGAGAEVKASSSGILNLK